ncbi:MAG: hypothetical protein V4719_01730 [Planctomycetota bacterium]
MSQNNTWAVRIQETALDSNREALQVVVTADSHHEAIVAGMKAGLKFGRCYVRVYDVNNDSHFPAGPVLYAAFAEIDRGIVTVRPPMPVLELSNRASQQVADLAETLVLLEKHFANNSTALEALEDAYQDLLRLADSLSDAY